MLCATFMTASPAFAQEIPPPQPFAAQPRQATPPPPDDGAAQPPSNYFQPETVPAEAPPTTNPGTGLEPESLPGELAEDIFQATDAIQLGPTAVSNVRFLMDGLGLDNWLSGPGIRTFGWVEGGYTGASTGTGLLSVQPRQNRFGDEFLAEPDRLRRSRSRCGKTSSTSDSTCRYFAGADAALGQPKGGIGYPVGDSHFGQDFRDLYLSAHLPILTDGGVDFKIGRMNTIIGYNGFLAPYRPFYSSDYQFFYSQDGAFTGFLTDLHVNNRLDIWNGMTLGANTFFTLRTPRFVLLHRPDQLLAAGRKTDAADGLGLLRPARPLRRPGPGRHVRHDGRAARSARLESDDSRQVLQSNMGWDANTPVGTGSWYGVYLISIYHLSTQDRRASAGRNGSTTSRARGPGVDTNYSEVTLGLNWHPFKCLEFRPEIRGDFAGAPAFGVNGTHVERSQLTGGISACSSSDTESSTRPVLAVEQRALIRGFHPFTNIRPRMKRIERVQAKDSSSSLASTRSGVVYPSAYDAGNGGQRLMGFVAPALLGARGGRGSSSPAAPILCSAGAGRSRSRGRNSPRRRWPGRATRPAAARLRGDAARPHGSARRFSRDGQALGQRLVRVVESARLRVGVAQGAELEREGQLGTGGPERVNALQ